jgi:NAD(P)H dehydrogenase (quinone)
VLAGSGHENKVYEFSGALATYEDLAAALGQALGHKVAVEHVDDAVFGKGLVGAGLPDFVAALLTGFASQIREGALAVESNDFHKVLGHPATPLKDAVQQLVNQVRSQSK